MSRKLRYRNGVAGAVRGLLLGYAIVLTGAACSQPAPQPEDEIRGLIRKLEKAVGDKDISTIKAHVSENYADDEGRDKEALKGLLAFFFLHNRSIHLLTRVQSIEFSDPEHVRTVVFAAVAGTRIPDASWLPRIEADIYRFEGTWKKETDGIWRLREAGWHPATTEDFG